VTIVFGLDRLLWEIRGIVDGAIPIGVLPSNSFDRVSNRQPTAVFYSGLYC
ncbi:uncharacterized protein METZ01_LOCUS354597, partial [marine metagenome]